MQEVKNTLIITCDVCGTTMPDFLDANESRQLIIRAIQYSVYYAEDKKIVDICDRCNSQIMNKLLDLMSGK